MTFKGYLEIPAFPGCTTKELLLTFEHYQGLLVLRFSCGYVVISNDSLSLAILLKS